MWFGDFLRFEGVACRFPSIQSYNEKLRIIVIFTHFQIVHKHLLYINECICKSCFFRFVLKQKKREFEISVSIHFEIVWIDESLTFWLTVVQQWGQMTITIVWSISLNKVLFIGIPLLIPRLFNNSNLSLFFQNNIINEHMLSNVFHRF